MSRYSRCSNYGETVGRRFAENCTRISTRKSKRSARKARQSVRKIDRTSHDTQQQTLIITSQATLRDQLINDVTAVSLLTSGRSEAHRLVRFARHTINSAALVLHALSVYMVMYRCMRSCTPVCGRAFSSALSSSLKKVHAHGNTAQLQARAS